jgi:hypothetical protein
MHLLQLLYPVLLAGANIAAGWLLYSVFHTPFGALLLAVGALLVVAVVTDAVRTASVTPSEAVSTG